MTDPKIKAHRGDVDPGRVRHMDQLRASQRRTKWQGLQVTLRHTPHNDPGRPALLADLAKVEATMRAAGQITD